MASQPPTKEGALPPVVALYASQAQSGKSASADVLVLEFGYERLKFAGPLKEMATSLFISVGFDYKTAFRCVEGDLKEEPLPQLGGITPRKIMQTLGTDWGQHVIRKTFWSDILIESVRTAIASGRRIVIDDLRFPHEWDALTQVGAECWRVIRPDMPPAPVSEYEGLLDNKQFDKVLINVGDLEVLRMGVRHTITQSGDTNV